MILPNDYVVDNKFLDTEDRYIVGQELSLLGEFSKNKGQILPRIIITPYAFNHFLEDNNLKIKIRHLLGSLNYEHHGSLFQISSYIKKLILESKMPVVISKPLLRKLEELNQVFIEVYYFQGRFLIGYHKLASLKGESVIVEQVRVAWANLFSTENLKKHAITYNNHHEFSVCIAIAPQFTFDIEGHVKTFGAKKGEYEIEARRHVRFTYNKHAKAFVNGNVLPGGKKGALKISELKTLLDFAKISEKVSILPHELLWGKYEGKIYVTKIMPISSYIEHNNSYDFFVKSLTVTPGITIGRLNVINEKEKLVSVSQDEIVLLKSLDKKMIDAIKKARGIILESEPHPEIVELLRSIGIPTVIKKRDRLLYSSGDIISLNATTGEIKRGSIVVS